MPSTVTAAIICFIVGIFLGLMFSFFYLKYYKWKKAPSSQNLDRQPDPMYEEVGVTIKQYKMDLNENISYASKGMKDQ